MKEFAVIGLGRFGSSLARTLWKMGHSVLAIDASEERVQAMMDTVTRAVQLDAMDEESLKALGIRNFDVVVVGIGQDVQANILVAITLKELGVKYVVAKAANHLHGKVLEKIGVDKVVYPERDMGIRLAHNLVSGNVLDYIELSPEYSIVEIVATGRIAGKTLGQLDLRARHNITVIAIKKPAGQIVASPGALDIIEEGDVVVAIGANKALERLEEK
ncbi:hypothetical protein SY88_15015 [Clostridiales bacterium PH28_bin88]|nr:hypothetical protein SY88_15015 [Clostridiales bacterium PH28_bin88]